MEERRPTTIRRVEQESYGSRRPAATELPSLDHYRLLGLDPGATTEEIERVYRRSVGRIHPDKFSNDSKLQQLAEQKMKQVNLAVQVLRDPRRRAEYDSTLNHPALPAPPLTRRLGGPRERYLGSVGQES